MTMMQVNCTSLDFNPPPPPPPPPTIDTGIITTGVTHTHDDDKVLELIKFPRTTNTQQVRALRLCGISFLLVLVHPKERENGQSLEFCRQDNNMALFGVCCLHAEKNPLKFGWRHALAVWMDFPAKTVFWDLVEPHPAPIAA